MIDCHFHTNRSYCADSDMTLEFIADSLIASDSLDAVVVTDHTFAIYFPKDVAWSWSYMSDPTVFDEHRDYGNARLEEYLASVEAFRSKGLRVGLETEIMSDGRFTFDPAFRGRLDVLIGSVHFLPFPADADKSEIFGMWRRNTSELINSGIDVLGHPFRYIAAHVPVTEDVVEDVVAEAVSAGVALELNSHYEIDSDPMMLRIVAEKGGSLALSTDAHRREEFGVFSYHKKMMEAAGLALEDFNLFPLSSPSKNADETMSELTNLGGGAA